MTKWSSGLWKIDNVAENWRDLCLQAIAGSEVSRSPDDAAAVTRSYAALLPTTGSEANISLKQYFSYISNSLVLNMSSNFNVFKTVSTQSRLIRAPSASRRPLSGSLWSSPFLSDAIVSISRAHAHVYVTSHLRLPTSRRTGRVRASRRADVQYNQRSGMYRHSQKDWTLISRLTVYITTSNEYYYLC